MIGIKKKKKSLLGPYIIVSLLEDIFMSFTTF